MHAPLSRSGTVATVGGAILVAAVMGCSLSLAIALIAVRLDASGYSARAIGVSTAMGGVSMLVGAPFIPRIARAIGVSRMLLLSLLIAGLTMVAFTWSDNYWFWLVLRFNVGLMVTVAFVLSEFWITSMAPPNWRGLAVGFYGTSLGAGFAIGPMLLTLTGTGGNVPFYLGAAIFVIASAPLAINSRTAPPLEQHSGKSMWTVLREAPVATLAALCQGGIEVGGLSLLPVYAVRNGLSATEGALFASAFVLGNTLLQLPVGALGDRIDPRRVLLGLAAAGFIGAVLLAHTGDGDVRLFELGLVFWGGTVGALYPMGLTVLARLYRGGDLANASSTYVMAYAVGMLIGPVFMGLAMDVAPRAGFFWAVATILALYLGLGLWQMARERGARS